LTGNTKNGMDLRIYKIKVVGAYLSCVEKIQGIAAVDLGTTTHLRCVEAAEKSHQRFHVQKLHGGRELRQNL
jgi:hypothetical protein